MFKDEMEPPIRKKKLNDPSFVDVRKLKGDMLVLKGAETVSKKESVGDKRKKDNVEAKIKTVKKKVFAAERLVCVKKGKQKINEGSLVSFKEGKKDKDERVLMVVEKGKEVVLNEKVKRDPVNILTRMSPSHLKNVLDSLTTQQVSVLEELGLGEYHNNFNFTSTPGKLGLWIVNNYDHEEHTIKMVDGRKIKVTRELIHEILGVPIGEIKVNALLNTTSEDETTTDWRRSTEFTKERINISKLDNHACSLTEMGWNFKVGFLVIFFSILAQGNKDGTVNQRFIVTPPNWVAAEYGSGACYFIDQSHKIYIERPKSRLKTIHWI
ncbi:hypothetical protein Tco_1061542 [Tanacetum coccineum]